jgi:hypothetical protein
MWERIDSLAEHAPDAAALRAHRLELIEGARRRAAGLAPHPDLAADESRAAASELAVLPILTRARDAYDGPLVVVKGPEVALDYRGPRQRPFGDLDILTEDPAAAQAALLAAGFVEVGDPSLYEDIHHLRPLWWPGLPLVIELHARPKWPARSTPPATAVMLATAVPGRLGIAGIDTLPPAEHALLLAAHAWAHEPLGRVGHLLDVAVTLRRTDPREVAALARRWRCARLWRATHAAVRAVIEGEGRSAGVALWGRHLRSARERTVFETHLQDWLSPLWGLPRTSGARAAVSALVEDGRREGGEPWRAKLDRARVAVGNAGMARSEHDVALEARGHTPRGKAGGA